MLLINNHRGNATLIQLAFATAGLITILSVITAVNGTENLLARQTASAKTENLKQYLNFAFRSRSTCSTKFVEFYNSGRSTQTVSSGGSAGGAPQSNPQSEERYRNSNNANNSNQVASRTRSFDLVLENSQTGDSFSAARSAGVTISDVQLSFDGDMARRYIAGSNQHLGELIVKVKANPFDREEEQSLILPFYVVYDSNNQISQCFTSRSGPSGLSAEDEICRVTRGQEAFFNPETSGCEVPTSTIAGQ